MKASDWLFYLHYNWFFFEGVGLTVFLYLQISVCVPGSGARSGSLNAIPAIQTKER